MNTAIKTSEHQNSAARGSSMKKQIFFWSLVSALAGFLFGFDTVVISGAEQKIQTLWGLSPALHGFAMGSALYGTVLGSLFGGWPTDRSGRKRKGGVPGLSWIDGQDLIAAQQHGPDTWDEVRRVVACLVDRGWVLIPDAVVKREVVFDFVRILKVHVERVAFPISQARPSMESGSIH